VTNTGTVLAANTPGNAATVNIWYLDQYYAASSISSTGLIEADGSSSIVHDYVGLNGNGTLRAENGGTVEIDGSVTGTDRVFITGSGSKVEFLSPEAATTSFAGAAGGTLALGASVGVTVDVRGFVTGDTIDLLNFDGDIAAKFDYTPNTDNVGGVLTITNSFQTTQIDFLTGGYGLKGFHQSTVAYNGADGLALSYTHP
jgi:hypothetical protein